MADDHKITDLDTETISLAGGLPHPYDPHGPGGRIDRRYMERRTIIVGVVFIVFYGLFTLVQSVSFLYLSEDTELDPAMARVSILINLVLLGLFVALGIINHVLISGGRSRRTFQAFSIHVAATALLLANLIHTHLGGSQHTQIPMAMMGIVLVVAWLLGQAASWTYYLVGTLGYIMISLLELNGLLPYAPLFVTGRDMGEHFLNADYVAFNVFMYAILTFQVLLVTHLFERDRTRRLRQLQKANEAATAALSEVSRLRDLIPMCSSCKKIRSDEGYWQDVTHYINNIGQGQVSHGICPECMEKLYPELAKRDE